MNIGDKVMVVKSVDGSNFRFLKYMVGKIGTVASLYFEDRDEFGIDFGNIFKDEDWSMSLHTLRGNISTKTGYYIPKACLTIIN